MGAGHKPLREPPCVKELCAPYIEWQVTIPVVKCHPGDCDPTCPCDTVLHEDGDMQLWTCACGGWDANYPACVTLVFKQWVGYPEYQYHAGYYGCWTITCPAPGYETSEKCVNRRTYGIPIPPSTYDACTCYDY